jgi:hypothetical protein
MLKSFFEPVDKRKGRRITPCGLGDGLGWSGGLRRVRRELRKLRNRDSRAGDLRIQHPSYHANSAGLPAGAFRVVVTPCVPKQIFKSLRPFGGYYWMTSMKSIKSGLSRSVSKDLAMRSSAWTRADALIGSGVTVFVAIITR